MSSEEIKLVNKLASKLLKETQDHKIIKVLQQLASIQMNIEILQATSIGKTVNSLRKSQGEIGKRSKNLVKRWKLLVPSSQAPPPPPSQLSSRSTLVIKKEEEPISQLAPPISNKQKEMVNHSPNVTSLETRKRKSDIDDSNSNSSLAIALSKRSRTQVYSGKSSGLKYVPLLFDLCMNVLQKNIDAIDEVGGIPFFVLEPVLSKCTPTQLMRLEELNPHFIEDSDSLWQRHTQKQFRDATPFDGQTWRDLYLERLASREEKMKSITSSIKARQLAREEPVRKAAVLSSLAPPPSRSRGASSWQQSSHSNSSLHRKSNLMKQTVKMAKDRRLMLSAKRK